ncbi:hypothetical protein DL95DRAFT_469595 [Leptodontidium sp. 2 PMI_412]|nr:hypothetical protein DL95DRAFT_469595 [Leptodontidium sp. 2 PMI_412]
MTSTKSNFEDVTFAAFSSQSSALVPANTQHSPQASRSAEEGQPSSLQNPKFQFVLLDGPKIVNPESKRLIKKHVMVDIGRSRRKKRRWEPGFKVFIPSVPHFGTTVDPFMKYPIEMSQRTHSLVGYIYKECVEETRSIYDYFLPIGISDPAAFHAVLALLTFHVRTKIRPRDYQVSMDYESTEITHHYTEAIKLLKSRVTNLEVATSDGTIGAILFMLTYTNISADYMMWHGHMKGLGQILSARDGWADPTQSRCLPLLLRLTLGWCDVLGCFTHDIHPKFPFHEYLVPLYPTFPTSVTLSPQLTSTITTLSTIQPDLELVIDLFANVAKFTLFLKKTVAKDPSIWQNHTFALHLQPLLYRLLSLSHVSLPNSKPSVVKDMLRVALLLYLAPMQRKFGIRIVRAEIQLSKLLGGFQNWRRAVRDWELHDLNMWIITMGFLEAYEEGHTTKDTYMEILSGHLTSSEMTSVEEVEERLRGMIWAEEIQGQQFRALRETVQGILNGRENF